MFVRRRLVDPSVIASNAGLLHCDPRRWSILLKHCCSTTVPKNFHRVRRHPRAEIIRTQKQARKLVKRGLLWSNHPVSRKQFQTVRTIWNAFRRGNGASDTETVNLTIALLERVADALRPKSRAHLRKRIVYFYSPRYWTPLFRNWRIAIQRHQDVPHPYELLERLQTVATKLPRFNYSVGVLAILRVLSYFSLDRNMFALQAYNILESMLQLAKTNNNPWIRPTPQLFRSVIKIWATESSLPETVAKLHILITSMYTINLRPNAQTWNCLLKFWKFHRNRTQFLEILKTMRQDHILPNETTVRLARDFLPDSDLEYHVHRWIQELQLERDERKRRREERRSRRLTGKQKVLMQFYGSDVFLKTSLSPTDESNFREDGYSIPYNQEKNSRTRQQLAILEQSKKSRPLPDWKKITETRYESLFNTTFVVPEIIMATSSSSSAIQIVDCALRLFINMDTERLIDTETLNDDHSNAMADLMICAMERSDNVDVIIEYVIAFPSLLACGLLIRALGKLKQADRAEFVLYSWLYRQQRYWLTKKPVWHSHRVQTKVSLLFDLVIEAWTASSDPKAWERAIRVLNFMEEQRFVRPTRFTYHALTKFVANGQSKG